MNPGEPELSGRQRVLLLVFLSAAAFYATFGPSLPSPRRDNAPAGEFSADRALRHIETIAAEPHPSGSAANQKVREYISARLLELGFEIEPQRFSFRAKGSGREVEGVNLIARFPKTVRTNVSSPPRAAVALACHYDSVTVGPGASDDGMGVATLLETARALKSGAPLKNDVFFIFTDGEEAGLQGARAVAEKSNVLNSIGLVLNFEARGVSGPVYMFETSAGNARLIREFAKSAPRPVANSLMYEVYRHMPNNTDLTVFKKAGLAGLNFGLIGDPQYYHTAMDDVAHIHRRTLQHEGSSALNLARHFSNLDLGELSAQSDAVYFDLLSFSLVSYDVRWALPLAVGAFALYLAAVLLGIKNRVLKLRGAFLSAVFWALLLLVIGLLFRAVAPKSNQAGPAFWLVCVAITLGLCVGARWIAGRRFRPGTIVLGALFWWALLGIATAKWLPGGSYLLAWPVLFQIGCFCGWAFLKGRSIRLALLVLGALPTVLLITPLVRQFYVALGSRAVAMPMLVLVLECGALSLQLEVLLGLRSCYKEASA